MGQPTRRSVMTPSWTGSPCVCCGGVVPSVPGGSRAGTLSTRRVPRVRSIGCGFLGSAGRVGVALRENLAGLRERPSPAADLDPRTKNVLLHLQLRGACFVQDLARPTGLAAEQALSALWELFWAGLVAPDTYSAILASTTERRAELARGSTVPTVAAIRSRRLR